MVRPFNISKTPVSVHNKWYGIIVQYRISITQVHYQGQHRFEALLFLYFIHIQPDNNNNSHVALNTIKGYSV